MQLTISAKNTTVTDAIRDYAEKRLAKLDKRLRGDVPVHLEIRREGTKRSQDKYVAEVTIRLKNGFVRSEERAESPYSAVDGAQSTVERQLRRLKTRSEKKRKEGSIFDIEALTQVETPEPPEADEIVKEIGYGQLVRTKEHVVVPMTVEDAASQMDLLGHNFFVYKDKDSGKIQVVYRRHDNDYGLIVPTEAG